MVLSRKRSRGEEHLRPPTGGSEASATEGRSPKFIQLDESDSDDSDEEQGNEETQQTMKCFLAPHAPMVFHSLDEYETHYHRVHVNRCQACHKNFPSEHFLNLHIAENHDPINQAKLDRGEKTFACFVEGCDKLCKAGGRRKLHCIDKHGFPKNYDFFIVNDGIDRRRSMLRQNRSKKKRFQKKSKDTPASPQSDETSAKSTPKSDDASMEDLTTFMSALKFVPSSVRFGGKARPTFARRLKDQIPS
jgi:hypothetical protein